MISLENNCFFLYHSVEKTSYEIMLECELIYDFAKWNKPLLIMQTYPINNLFEISYYVKYYMNIYGYEKVKGGVYTEYLPPMSYEELACYEMDYLMRHLDWSDEANKIIKEYAYRPLNKSEVEGKKKELQEDMVNYMKDLATLEKHRGSSLKNRDDHIQIDDSLLDYVDWIRHISKNGKPEDAKGYLSMLEQTDKRAIYQETIKRMRIVYDIYTEIAGELTVSDEPYIKYPQFIFDTFVYPSSTSAKPSQINAEKICDKYEYMINYLINRIAEYEFHISTYPQNMFSRIYLLDKIAERI
jgi:hypothetical protein